MAYCLLELSAVKGRWQINGWSKCKCGKPSLYPLGPDATTLAVAVNPIAWQGRLVPSSRQLQQSFLPHPLAVLCHSLLLELSGWFSRKVFVVLDWLIGCKRWLVVTTLAFYLYKHFKLNLYRWKPAIINPSLYNFGGGRLFDSNVRVNAL